MINLVVAIVIIIIALLIHWYTLSWKVDEEEEAETNPSAPPLPQLQTNDSVTTQSMIRETENPLRIHVSIFDSTNKKRFLK